VPVRAHPAGQLKLRWRELHRFERHWFELYWFELYWFERDRFLALRGHHHGITSPVWHCRAGTLALQRTNDHVPSNPLSR
jgi:hypothetical protein